MSVLTACGNGRHSNADAVVYVHAAQLFASQRPHSWGRSEGAVSGGSQSKNKRRVVERIESEDVGREEVVAQRRGGGGGRRRAGGRAPGISGVSVRTERLSAFHGRARRTETTVRSVAGGSTKSGYLARTACSLPGRITFRSSTVEAVIVRGTDQGAG